MKENYSLKDLHRLSTPTWLFHAAWNWAELVLYFFIASKIDSLFGLWGMSLVIGVRMHGLALLGHEGIHNAISKNKTLNDLLTSFLCAYPLLQSMNVYSGFHLGHHRYLGNEHKDPEIQYRKHTPEKWSLPIGPKKLIHILFVDLIGLGVWETLNLFKDNKGLRARDLIPQSAFWLAGFVLFFYLDMSWVPLLWTFSFFTSYWAAFRMRGLVEHLGTDDTHRYSANWIERFFYMPHDSWYHYEHHKWPGIPFYNLKYARELDKSVPVRTLTDVLRSYSEARQKNISKEPDPLTQIR